MRREFYLQDDSSNKFWTVEVDGCDMLASNGRIGAQPRQTRTAYASAAEAQQAADKAILAKRRKGYIEGPLAKVPPYRDDLPPRFVRINHDDYLAQYVGRTAGGEQFFLTFPFSPRSANNDGGNYIALYRFDEFGLLLDAQIFDERAEGLKTQTQVDAFTDALLDTLGKHRHCDIKVAPFSVQKFGLEFGLIYDAGEDEDDEDYDDEEDYDDDDEYRCVTVEPGNYMAFHPPWDGDYDT